MEATNNAVVEPVVSTVKESSQNSKRRSFNRSNFSAYCWTKAQAAVVEQTLPNTEPTTEKLYQIYKVRFENPAISEAQTTAKGDLVIEITKIQAG